MAEQARWKAGARFSIPATVAYRELERIKKANGREALPCDVVNAARNKNSPLHRCFVWDDSIAAEKWREQQARIIIHSVHVVYKTSAGEEKERIAYIHVRKADGSAGYLTAAEVVSDADLYKQALEEAVAVLNGWRMRYAHLKELQHIFDEIAKMAGTKRKVKGNGRKK